MHVLVTRPKSDAAELQARLEALGHEVSVEPLLEIEPLNIDPAVFSAAQAVVATSRNALRALAASKAFDPARTLPLFAIGEATAEMARELGFFQVIAGPGTGRGLVPVIAAAAKSGNGPLVHVAGETLAFDLAGALAEHGYETRLVTAYRAVPTAQFSAGAEEAISAGMIDTVILMSPRTAAIFAQLAGTTKLKEKARRLTFLCLSAGVAEKLSLLHPLRVVVAAKPNTEAMLETLAGMAPSSSGV